MNRVIVLIMGMCALGTGCLAPVPPVPRIAETSSVSSPPTAASPTAQLPESTRPTTTIDTPSEVAVDPFVDPVSLSAPPPDAARTFEMCAIRQWIDRDGLDVIAGLGRIDHANDAFHYVRLTQREPELEFDRPAWIVSFRGEVRMAMSNTIYLSPACIVVSGGDGGFFGSNGTRQVQSNVRSQPVVVPVEPDRALPAPLP